MSTTSLTITGDNKVLLDEEDMGRIVEYLSTSKASPYKWQVSYNTSDKKMKYYATKTIGGRSGKKWKMHRLILHLRGIEIDGMEVDHINGDTLDNRFSNLRLCTSSQNGANAKLRSDNKTGYKGVRWNKNNSNWNAYIQEDGKFKHLGCYDTAEDAALAYNRRAIELWGEYAWTNHVKKK